jgi:septum formation protein
MLNKILNTPVLLGSQSPRRRSLITQLGFSKIRTATAQTNEEYPDTLDNKIIPEFLARQKAIELLNKANPDELLITADTLVFCNNTILGKPNSETEAKAMLKKLSNNTHQVVTGVCLAFKNEIVTFSETTNVTFSALSKEEIDFYVDKYKPFDKAGSYGIQEWIGYIGIKNINGCYYNVMGLPLHRLYEEIKKSI